MKWDKVMSMSKDPAEKNNDENEFNFNVKTLIKIRPISLCDYQHHIFTVKHDI